MTTIDTARLRALAEAAQEVESVGSEWHSTEGFHEDCGLDIRDAEYLAAIDPPTLIALLDERERLRGEGTRWYTAAYRARTGNVIPIGVENTQRGEAEHVVEEFRREDPEGPEYFVATRIQPAWEPVEGDGDE